MRGEDRGEERREVKGMGWDPEEKIRKEKGARMYAKSSTPLCTLKAGRMLADLHCHTTH